MTRMRLLGIGLVAAIAASAALASGAMAGEYNLKSLPEIGRCKKVATGGEFRGVRCFHAEANTGQYAWFSGPGPKAKFTGKLSSGLELRLVGISATTSCATGTLSGEFTGPKNLTATLVLKSCVGEGHCQNKAGSTEGELTSEELVGELGFISHPRKLRIGWALRPNSGSNLFSFECGGQIVAGKSTGGGATREVQGSVIGVVQPLTKMVGELAISEELERHGAQYPEKFEGGVKDTLTTILGEKLPGVGKSTHATLQVAKELLKLEEPYEVLGRCTGTC